MPDSKGIPHKLSEWKGRPLMVNFWATWCDPCRREIPLLKSLRHERSGESLEVIGIAVDLKDAVVDYTRKIGIDYPVLIGEKDGMAAIDAFGMDTVFPFTVFADRRGRIFTVKVGELGRDEAKIILGRPPGRRLRVGCRSEDRPAADRDQDGAAQRAQRTR